MRRRFGLSVAMIVSLDGCVDDPTFIQADAGGVVGDSAGGTSSGGTSSGTSGTPGTSSGTSGTSSGTNGSTTSSSGTSGTPARCSAPTCAGAGGKCDGDACVITCPGSARCGDEIKCPTGMACRVTCGSKSCKRVTCNGADSCSVTCDGDQACSDQVTVNSASSTVICHGKDACKKVDCEGANCAVTCDPPSCETKDVHCCATKSCLVNTKQGECK